MDDSHGQLANGQPFSCAMLHIPFQSSARSIVWTPPGLVENEYQNIVGAVTDTAFMHPAAGGKRFLVDLPLPICQHLNLFRSNLVLDRL